MIQFLKVENYRFRLDLLKSYEVQDDELILKLNDPDEAEVTIGFESEHEAEQAASKLDQIFFKAS